MPKQPQANRPRRPRLRERQRAVAARLPGPAAEQAVARPAAPPELREQLPVDRCPAVLAALPGAGQPLSPARNEPQPTDGRPDLSLPPARPGPREHPNQPVSVSVGRRGAGRQPGPGYLRPHVRLYLWRVLE